MIVLLRHGATATNLRGAFLSREDPPLDALGHVQAERAHAVLAAREIDLAYCSPMRRATETLAIVRPSAVRTIVDELREIDFGQWEGRTIDWLERNDPDGVRARREDPVSFRPPGGESFLDVARRLEPFARRLRDCRQDVLVVAHRGSLGVLERLLRGLPIGSREVEPLEPGAYRELIVVPNHARPPASSNDSLQ